MEGVKNFVLKKEVRVKDKVLTIELPDEFKGKEVEITVRVKREIEKEILADQIQVDTTKWKFSREELYERF
ncbi:MAG: hypothetical protein RRA63_09015 [Candidatus Calescibacterium sp.]|nr:hypothetical protein [Candidatus Calescibacterium sp.]